MQSRVMATSSYESNSKVGLVPELVVYTIARRTTWMDLFGEWKLSVTSEAYLAETLSDKSSRKLFMLNTKDDKNLFAGPKYQKETFNSILKKVSLSVSPKCLARSSKLKDKVRCRHCMHMCSKYSKALQRLTFNQLNLTGMYIHI